MSNLLLSYYEQELRFIRDEAVRFSQLHPGAAEALGIRKDTVDDPQIARLIESVALLNGRLQQRLDASYPELAESLVNLLYPHYLRPLPSYSLLEFTVNPGATTTHRIPSGTEFDVINEYGESVVFRTTETIDLYPIRTTDVSVKFAPFEKAKPSQAENANAMFAMTIETTDGGIELSTLTMDCLRLQIKGDSHFALRLYDLISQRTVQVCAVANGQRFELGKDAIQPIGFEGAETVLPYHAASFDGFKLLTEFFQYPERFNGFVIDLHNIISQIQEPYLQLQIFVEDMDVELAHRVSAQHFTLFSSPIVNLCSQGSTQVEVDFLQSHYRLHLENLQGKEMELFSIDEVWDITFGDPVSVPRLFAETFNSTGSGLRWQLKQTLHDSGALDSSLKVANLEHISENSEPHIWLINATSTDGTRASQFPVTSDVTCRDPLTIPAEMQLLRRPSLPVRHRDTSKNVWALLCHLHFNYHTILGAENPAAALKKMLNLYNHNKNAQNQAYIESLQKIEQEKVVAPIRISGKSCFTHGTKITVILNPTKVDGGLVLFSHFLDRFFANFVGFNSFIQMDVCLEGQLDAFLSFPRRSGCKHLL
ncbi:type VI secretion system baseplate subunit TssF [Vibrio sp. S4M6]|uniref:type VI secretion system baseplate subunit TssF n=1 Tax=Vibrio sinus TaxID=2946865 RepID=UPI00202AB1B9|nr:type VI secretion system baseplate subunit TssF [Vibrio sinus]MCL9781227.1 type VI secretion system baseplate subunit TssF [Vibrio sinus]